MLDSLDTEVDEDAETAWATEVNRRVAELDSGAVRDHPSEQKSAADSPRADAPVRGQFHPLAVDEAQAAERWVPRRNEIASARFQRELDRAVNLISERPNTGSPYLGNTKRVLLRRSDELLPDSARGLTSSGLVRTRERSFTIERRKREITGLKTETESRLRAVDSDGA